MANLAGSPPKTTDEIFMDELKQEFMESVTRNLVELQELYKEKKYDEIARIAHDIKGTAGVFGLDEGSDIARDLQYAARDDDAAKIKDLIDRLTTYMKEHSEET